MAWETVSRSAPAKKTLPLGIHVAVAQVTNRKQIMLHLSWVGVPAWCRTEEGLAIEAGSGEHAGLLRLSKGGRFRGIYKERNDGLPARMRIFVANLPGLPAMPAPSMPCCYEESGESVVITLPKWGSDAFISPTSFEAAKVDAAPIAPPVPLVDVSNDVRSGARPTEQRATLADAVKPAAAKIAPVKAAPPVKPTVAPAARETVAMIGAANGRPEIMSTAQAIRWGAERGIPGPKLDLVRVNAKRRHLGLPNIMVEG